MAKVDDMLASVAHAYRDTGRWTGLAEPSLRVMEAMRRVPRERFVPADAFAFAHDDRALDIGRGQTISQPFVVALMSELCAVEPGMRVLEIGTGSGYQAAILAELGAAVASIELDATLGNRAARLLRELGYELDLRIGDGAQGWPDAAPFPRILATAAAPALPPAWIDQLALGGRLVAPVGPGGREQTLELVTKNEIGAVQRRAVLPVRFVPLRSG